MIDAYSNLQVVELEVQEEMMSDFEQGFWDGVTYGSIGVGAIGLMLQSNTKVLL